MSEDNKDQQEDFVVKDRRRFDNSGNERVSESSTETVISEKISPINSNSANTNTNSTSTIRTESPLNSNLSHSQQSGEAQSEEALDFSSFIVSLATQAMVQLGVMSPPPGLELPKDKEAARQTIDLISMLQTKTKGNLDPAETRLMDDILHNLRMAFLQS